MHLLSSSLRRAKNWHRRLGLSFSKSGCTGPRAFSFCAAKPRRSGLRIGGQQVGVTRKEPLSIDVLAQDCQRVAGAVHRLLCAGRGYRNLQVIPEVPQITADLYFPDIAFSLDTDIFRGR